MYLVCEPRCPLVPAQYKKNADFPTFPAGTSPAELAAECDTIQTAHVADNTKPSCVGFHSGPWMSLFGTGLNEPGATYTDAGWAGDAGQGPPDGDTTTMDTTKPNHQYVCFYKAAEDPCFPSHATVTKSDGMAVRIDTLVEGDEIRVATDTGALTTDTVTLLSISQPEARERHFLKISTTAGKNLTLTPQHHIPVGAECCSTLIKADDLVVGEKVWTVGPGKTAVSTTVKAITNIIGSGLHSPVTLSGTFPIVDGLVTSFDEIEKVTLAKHGLAALITACKATDTCEEFKHTFLGADRKYVHEHEHHEHEHHEHHEHHE